ncbi:two-component system histidine kinase [Azoarcus olearius]|uniref:histidine kinase n=1 Tax=Azoarcus sp. (strain BH72) TaxID=418699 RepID=A1KBT3_AZOSB|nr:two-component system histidine kinase [Azoarcus olearius]CAL96289.1 two-component system histidine kinase [Azoarcus olearius]
MRRQLLITLLGAVLGVFLIGSLATYQTTRGEVDEIMDYHLRQLALSLRAPQYGAQPELGPDDQLFDMVIQVWDEQGLRLYLSRPHTALPDRAQLGYATVPTAEGDWRTYSIVMGSRVVQVAQPMSHRNRLAAAAALRTLTPLLVILPLLAGLIWYLVGRGLRPLERLARAVGQRRPDSLAPLAVAGVPDEAQPLVQALNGLLGRLDHAMSAQRAFVADAAHELRTPLAALQLQLQLTERAGSEAERRAALGELRQGLLRATRVVQQLLTLARQTPDAAAAGAPPAVVDLVELVALVTAELQALAEARGIDLGAEQLDSGSTVHGDRDSLRTLVVNLIDNAIRYTPAGGRVDLRVWHENGRVWLEVADDGPGIPVEERERVLDRFYRRAGQEQPGSGLGLAIVKAIADRHGAELRLDESARGGLAVRVGLPAAPVAAEETSGNTAGVEP